MKVKASNFKSWYFLKHLKFLHKKKIGMDFKLFLSVETQKIEFLINFKHFYSWLKIVILLHKLGNGPILFLWSVSPIRNPNVVMLILLQDVFCTFLFFPYSHYWLCGKANLITIQFASRTLRRPTVWMCAAYWIPQRWFTNRCWLVVISKYFHSRLSPWLADQLAGYGGG